MPPQCESIFHSVAYASVVQLSRRRVPFRCLVVGDHRRRDAYAAGGRHLNVPGDDWSSLANAQAMLKS